MSVRDSHFKEPRTIEVRGARVHNLKNIDVDVPLHCLVGISGVSGSGKSSLALGVLYAEGSRRYLEALSTYTRRRIGQQTRAQVDEVLHVPAAIALRQRPGIPDVHSTFGTSTELLNYLRLMFSRLSSYMCPNGHRVPPSLNVAAERPLKCPTCGIEFHGLSAEDLAFNSGGACPTCGGTGVVRTVDESTLIADPDLSLKDGAVAPWRQLMWSLMPQVAHEMGVRIDIPYKDLTDHEKDIVLHGPMEKKHILYVPKNKDHAAELDFTYYSAVNTVKNALSKVKDDKGLARVAKFLKSETCPDCHGTRLSKTARMPHIGNMNLAQVAALTLDGLRDWLPTVVSTLPDEMIPMAESIISETKEPIERLEQLGLGYLALDRASSTLSNGERQRVQLARAVRTRTTGVLYVLDEPSIGLHPSNVEGLLGVMDDLLEDGNSVVFVDHDVQVLRRADWIIEIGPGSGADGGRVIAQGPIDSIESNPASRIGPFLSGRQVVRRRHDSEKNAEDATRDDNRKDANAGSGSGAKSAENGLFDEGRIQLDTDSIHTVHPLDVAIPEGKLTAVTGVSGSGKTTLVLESLIPALEAHISGRNLPSHVKSVDPADIKRVDLVDATPIGVNVRSTVATYSGVMDDLRKLFAKSPDAKSLGLKAGDFSYNTGSLRCATCDGTGQISLDVQFLPDVDIPCPSCNGSRYSEEAYKIRVCTEKGEIPNNADNNAKEPEYPKEPEDSKESEDSKEPEEHGDLEDRRGSDNPDGLSLPDMLAMTVDELLSVRCGIGKALSKLQTLHDLGLGYLTLGESTPALSGGEAQRLKLASEMHRDQNGSLFVFDEPTIGLHPLDVETLIEVLDKLIDRGATVLVIEHDLDIIANADYVIDMGPGGGEAGGRIVATGTPRQISSNPESITGRYLPHTM